VGPHGTVPLRWWSAVSMAWVGGVCRHHFHS